MNTFHKPVMVAEVMNGLDVATGKKYIDATFGGGGHSIEILKRGGIVLGIDRDPEAVELAKQNLQWKIVRGNFRDIEKIAKENGFENADGILFDLGVSSHQIDTPSRGFSYRYEKSPLDLRMDPEEGIPAGEYINKLSEEELYEIFTKFGEEKLARAIAGAIVRARRKRPLTTVGDVVEIVSGKVRGPKERVSTLSRIFQALRIVVNDELGALKSGLRGAKKVLKPGGRLAVLSFHSLEDRIVKRETRELGFRPVNKRPMTPRANEIQENHRSRSAKLRIAVK